MLEDKIARLEAMLRATKSPRLLEGAASTAPLSEAAAYRPVAATHPLIAPRVPVASLAPNRTPPNGSFWQDTSVQSNSSQGHIHGRTWDEAPQEPTALSDPHHNLSSAAHGRQPLPDPTTRRGLTSDSQQQGSPLIEIPHPESNLQQSVRSPRPSVLSNDAQHAFISPPTTLNNEEDTTDAEVEVVSEDEGLFMRQLEDAR
ncbi:hypothetical protein NX059_006348 [Plenodomus lindquistii]|nr:hypothetical protein NX059_006348 [Plenodomus lindquistii]